MSDMDNSKLCVLGGFWLIFVYKPGVDAETNGLFFRQQYRRKGPHTYPQKESENFRGCWWRHEPEQNGCEVFKWTPRLMGRTKVKQQKKQPVSTSQWWKRTKTGSEKQTRSAFWSTCFTEKQVLKQMTRAFTANEAWDLHLCHVQMSLQYRNSSEWQDGTAGPVPDWCQPPLAFLHHPLMPNLLLSSTAHNPPDDD